MIETAVIDEGWPSGDWQLLAAAAVEAAVKASAHGNLKDLDAVVEVAVRLTSDAEVRTLNGQYREAIGDVLLDVEEGRSRLLTDTEVREGLGFGRVERGDKSSGD